MDTKLNKPRALVILLLTVASLTANAQQEQLSTQYLFNTQTVNPAYAGTWESVGFSILTRQQWNGFEEAPQSITFTMQAPLSNEKMGLGLNVINDKVGFEKRFCVFSDYSYLVRISKKTNLRIGIKGGFTNYSTYDNNYLLKSDETDITSQERLKKSMLNVGAGAFLYSKQYYVGFSIPKIINNKFEDNTESFALDCEHQNYYLMSGLVINLGRNLIFKPTTLARATLNSSTGRPAEIDVTANFLIHERLWLGAMLRTNETYGLMGQWIFKGNLRLGYAHNMVASNVTGQNSSHEIMVSYELASIKNSFGSPRYF